MTSAVGEGGAVQPFRIDVPEEDLVDLRRRLAQTRWPDKETVSDRSQGVQLTKLRPLVEYWATGYDWRKVEATLNALPSSSPRSTGSTSNWRTSARRTRTRCRCSLRTAGRVRSSSS